MVGRTLSEAARAHLEKLNRALNCVVDARIVLAEGRATLAVGVDVSATIAGDSGAPRVSGAPVRLGAPHPIWFQTFHAFRIEQSPGKAQRYQVVTTAYTYRYLMTDQREIIAFHWNPMARPPQRTYPHLHIGSLITSGSTFLPDRFNKLHIPTGPLSLEQVLRFAIEELDVRPPHGRTTQEALAILTQGDDGVSGPPSSS